MNKFLGFCSLVLLAVAASATPYNTATLDGRPIEYDDYDFRETFHGESEWGANGTLSNLFVTWDANYLYIALQAWQAGNNKLVVLLDVDPGAGTGATTTTNWTNVDPSFIKYNDYGWVAGVGGGFGLDYMFASEGFYNNAIRILYDGVEAPTTNNLESLFDSGNGATPVGTPVDMASVNDATQCPHKGFETRIPWTNLYAGTRFGIVEAGETVPRGATLRLLAGIHNNDPASAWSSSNTIPNQTTAPDCTNGILTTLDYMEVTVDANTNGIPDDFGSEGNAPYIRAAAGAIGGSSVFVAFNEAVTYTSAVDVAHWTVGGETPSSAVGEGPYGVILGLAAPIATNFLVVRASGVQDLDGFSRTTEYCLTPASSGISQSVTVTFQVNTNSGMGISSDHARPTAFFLNGSALPLEWGYPPYETTPLTAIPGSNGWAAVDVTFPPGSPAELYYKFSARIAGTNNYEAIRLTDFSSASRKLSLNTNGAPMTVVDYLGAAAHPLRDPGNTNPPSAHSRLYNDLRRGDAGVRVRREILFQLDLSMRKRDDIQRVFVAGSDPLRGFNSNGGTGPEASDYPGAYVAWDAAGVQLFDDGSNGDVAADDGIYSRLWAFSTNGVDSAIEPESPYSLVAGGEFNEPYVGTWLDRRSPRSLIYKFYVLTATANHYESPSSNLEYYVADPDATDPIALDAFVWDNESLPPPPPSNAPALTAVTLTGATAYVQFENVLTEGSHGVRVSTNLVNGFDDYGLRATAGATNETTRFWSAAIPEISGAKEYYAPYAGQEPAQGPTYWEPSFIPATATTWRVHFSQYKTNLKGGRALTVTGPFAGWGLGSNLTFLGNGHWVGDVDLAAAASGSVLDFKFRNGDTWLDIVGNLTAVRDGGVTWTPDQPIPDQLFTVTLDAAGTPLATASNVYLHMGFDGWKDVVSPRPAMTNTSGTIWEYAFSIPTNYSVSVDWVFTTLPTTDVGTWYSPANWHAFMYPFVHP